MWVKTKNGAVAAYPYTVEQLKADYPNVSFSSNVTTDQLSDFNVFDVVHAETPAYDATTQRIETSLAPVLIHGVWTLTKTVVDLTQDQIDQKISAQWNVVRTERNKKLAATDWTQSKDSPLSAEKQQEWAAYRQSLRDITLQEDPFNIVWPTEPQ